MSVTMIAGVPPGVVLADAGYGADMKFQARLLRLAIDYVVGVQPTATVSPDGKEPLPAETPGEGRGRPPTRLRRQDGHQPVAVELLARSLPAEAWRDIVWREGMGKAFWTPHFTALRMRPAHRDEDTAPSRGPSSDSSSNGRQKIGSPSSTGSPTCPATRPWNVSSNLAKLYAGGSSRSYQELKQELGLGHYEGRGWRGFHHHAALCIAAYGFLVAEQLRHFPLKRWRRPGPGPAFLRYPKASCLAAVPARAERHVTSSIATKRAEIAVHLAQRA